MSRRGEIVDAIALSLNNITTNGYSYDKVTYWQDTSTQESKNHLDYRDTTEEEIVENKLKIGILSLEISAVVHGEGSVSAAEMGTIAIADLRQAVSNLNINRAIPLIRRSHKYVETKGKTACLVEVEIDVKYKF